MAHGVASALKDQELLGGSTEFSAGSGCASSSSLILPLAQETDEEESRRKGFCEDSTGGCLAASSYAPIAGTESRQALIAPLPEDDVPAEAAAAAISEEEAPGVAVVQHHCGCWAWLSHFFFLLGSLLYFWLAVWDIRDESTWYDDDDDDNSSIILSTTWRTLSTLAGMDRHTLLSAAAALCYVGDAGLTMAQLPTIYFRHSSKITRQVLFFMGNSVTFGLGALLEFTAAVTEVSHLEISNWTAVVAMHAYLVNAAIVLFFKKRRKHYGYCGVPVTFSERLELTGDVLFGVGCSVDVSLSYYYNDRTTDSEWIWVDRGNLVSAVLWLVDSILYIAADFYYFNHIEEEDGQELMVDHSLSGRFREPLISSTDSEDEFAVELFTGNHLML